MNLHLAYGKRGLDITIPDRNVVKVLTMEGSTPLPDPAARLESVLLRPTGAPPLTTLAASARSACIVICDITRPVPNALLLPPLLRTLEANGVARENITLLVATGLHRPSTVGELDEMVGPEIRQTHRIVNHRARERDEQVFLGNTRRGTPVWIDRVYVSADLKITTGFIEPHLMAGFSGGRKLIAPGCAGEETIRSLHSPAFIEHPECREGVTEGNPLHEELLEIAGLAGHDFIVNVTLDPDHAVTGIFAGHPVQAHAEGIDHARRAVRSTIDAPADVVITTSAGYPLDLTLYQAVKGMTAALPVVRSGGTLILAAECAEGLGSPEFTALATSFSSAPDFLSALQTRPVVIDQWQLEECAKAAVRADVILVSPTIAAAHGDRLFIRAVQTPEEALRLAFARHGSDARVAVIPKGPYTLVEVDVTAA
jgi:nickel-dependent lactate racemase